MKLEWTILGSAVLIAASIAMTDRWEIVVPPGSALAVFRLNRWTGEVKLCAPKAYSGDVSSLSGIFQPVCEDKSP